MRSLFWVSKSFEWKDFGGDVDVAVVGDDGNDDGGDHHHHHHHGQDRLTRTINKFCGQNSLIKSSRPIQTARVWCH